MSREDEARRSLVSDPSLGNHLAVAEALWRSGADEAAARVLQGALDTFGDVPGVLMLLSLILAEDDPRSALRYLRRAERAGGATPDLLERIGVLLGREDKTKPEAEEYFARVIDADPTTMYSRLYLANLVWERGDTERAERIFRDAAAHDDGSELAIASLADFLAHEDGYAESGALYDSLTKRDPLFMYWEARMLNWSGRTEEAIALLRGVLDIAPSMERPRLLLARLTSD